MDMTSCENDETALVFDVPDEQIVQSSKGKGWPGIHLAEIIHPCEDFASPAIPLHVLVLNLGSPFGAHEQLGGQQGRMRTGGIAILPADAPRNWHLEPEGEVRHLHLYLPPPFLSQIAASADLNPDTVELIGALGATDPQIEAIALSYFSELRSNGLGGQIYTESLANLLAIHLLRHHSSLTRPALPRVSRLDAGTLKRVVDCIEDSLAEDLSLSVLASLVGLSPYHFARCFKASLGISPHQYILQRRVERARLLLTTGNQSLTAIAHAVGFASESHLALHMKRLTGLNPKQYRS